MSKNNREKFIPSSVYEMFQRIIYSLSPSYVIMAPFGSSDPFDEHGEPNTLISHTLDDGKIPENIQKIINSLSENYQILLRVGNVDVEATFAFYTNGVPKNSYLGKNVARFEIHVFDVYDISDRALFLGVSERRIEIHDDVHDSIFSTSSEDEAISLFENIFSRNLSDANNDSKEL